MWRGIDFESPPSLPPKGGKQFVGLLTMFWKSYYIQLRLVFEHIDNEFKSFDSDTYYQQS